MADVSQAVKAAVLARLDVTSAVTSLVPADRIFPMQPEAMPAYPFIRYGVPTVLPYEDSCGAGSQITVSLHAFALSETQAQQIAAAVVEAIDNMPGFASCDWARTQFMPDRSEESVWHAVVDFSVVHTV